MKIDEYLYTIEKLGFSAADFCKCHGISLASLYKYKKGQPPRLHEGEKIVKATNGTVSLKDLGILP